MDGGFDVPVSIIPPLKVSAKAHVKMKTVPSKAATRNTRGPVYFKCVRVEYDKESGRLNLPKGEFLGKTVHRDVGDEEDKEYSETTLAFENEEDDLAGKTHSSTYPIYPICYFCLFRSRLESHKRCRPFKGFEFNLFTVQTFPWVVQYSCCAAGIFAPVQGD